jgi:hypothetical protein
MDYPESPDLFEGKFTDGDPVAGIPASVASAEHMNAVYDELLNVITFAGITPAAETKNQLKQALEFYRNASNLNEGKVSINRLPVTSSSSDKTPSKLMQTGDGGLLSETPSLLNPDNIGYTTFFRCREGVEGGTYPPGVALLWGISIINDAGYRTQLAFSSAGGLRADYSRTMHAGVWGAWQETWSSRNLQKASATDVDAGTSDTSFISPLALAQSSRFPTRAWVNFNGTGTVSIVGSGNVSSVTDNGTGDYTINFITPMSNDTYGISQIGLGGVGVSSTRDLRILSSSPPTVSGFRVQCQGSNESLLDTPYGHLQVFG